MRMATARQLVSSAIPRRVLEWVRRGVEHVSYPPEFTEQQIALFRKVEPYTMTSPERVLGLYDAVHYILANRIPGDFVECGVWRGGSMMTVALALLACEQTRELYLFDTFTGMSDPSSLDVSWRGKAASALLRGTPKKAGRNIWCVADEADVRRNLATTGYDLTRVHLVAGAVEQTLPSEAPPSIALLRLDTDWYESTSHELQHLYPRLMPGGVLIVDDYGHWRGARRAVDEYFDAQPVKPLLCRLDHTGRIAVKP